MASLRNPFQVTLGNIVFLVCLFGVAGVASVLISRANSVSPKMVGINGTYDSNKYVDDAKDLNAQWMRIEQWGDVASYDSVPSTLNRLSSRNIRMIPLVNNYGVGWVTPSDKSQWVNQLVYTAKTYGAGGSWWSGKTDLGSPVIEVSNEAYGQWYPWPNESHLYPGEYAKMLKQASQAVSQATNGRVRLIASVTTDYLDINDLSGGNTGTSKSWAREMKKSVPDIENYIAGVAAHPYGDIPSIGIGTSNDPNWSHQSLYTVHSQWSVPVYVTEVGQKGPKIGRDKQAAAVNFYFDELKQNDWIAGLFYYNQKDFQPYKVDGDNGWALIDDKDVRSEAWTAYRNQAVAYIENVKAGDINSDTHVDIVDLSILLGDYGKFRAQAAYPGSDIDGSGRVDIADLSMLLSRYGS